jgi:ATP phosphoribosyltransferase regulatory subunit
MSLRLLYKEFGYSLYRLSRFEEYELYADNKAFLSSDNIVTFTGNSGRLMALRPDVTLSIVKNAPDSDNLQKLYYNENVYRPDGFEFKEQMQVGLECIGDITTEIMAQVLILAFRSLEVLGEPTYLAVSHMGYISGLLNNEELTSQQSTELLQCVSEKNIPSLLHLCESYDLSTAFTASLCELISLQGSFDALKDRLSELCINEGMEQALSELATLNEHIKKSSNSQELILDFSIINDLSYYSGIIFQGYVEGIPTKILSGGRYDKLLRKFGKRSGAIGFAVYLDLMERYIPTEQMISIALPKGRLGEKAYAMFEKAGFGCPSIHEESRKLVFENPQLGIRYFWVKPSDVPIYVERGAADIGVAGKDILLEYSPDVYELLDLKIGKCKMSVAGEKGFKADNLNRTLRVATKFPNIARTFYNRKGIDIDIIGLNGSIELAPLLFLSDVIVDIVETGKTLFENNLEPLEDIVNISARLISNKSSYKFNQSIIADIQKKIGEEI